MAPVADKHIYFLDDEPTIREVVRETLEDSHFKVNCFGDPIKCLSQLRFGKCNLLITDLKMPEKDGIEILLQVKQLAPWLPVLIITGYGDIPTAVKAMKIGAVDFIEKPLDKKKFVNKIRSIIQKNLPSYSDLDIPLTQTELRVLRLIVKGKSNKEIATMLNRSVRTIEVHRTRIYRKVGVDNLVDLVKRVLSMGMFGLQGKDNPYKDKQNSENV